MKLALLLLCACATGGVQSWDSTGEVGGWAQKVVGTEFCADAFSDARCRAWYRPGTDPVAGPMWFLLGPTGDACPVTPEQFTMARTEENYTCKWRHAR